MSLSIVFMGTPEFGVPSLNMLIENGYHVQACITQPDRKAGRGHKLMPPPVKLVALEHGIPVLQFEKVSDAHGVKTLEELQPDLLITAAYGQILSDTVLSIPKYGCINVHASLLPKYRGAAPINWVILNGEKVTGVTTMYTVKKLDAGDILEQDEVTIPEDMTAGELYDILSNVGAKTLQRTLIKLQNGELERHPQNEAEATYYPMFSKGFGEIDFNESCENIYNYVRGLNPFPGAYVLYHGEKIRVYEISRHPHPTLGINGEIVKADAKHGLLVKSRDGVLSLDLIKRPGGRLMTASSSLRGKTMEEGYVFVKLEEDET